jgi:hypothetical protein
MNKAICEKKNYSRKSKSALVKFLGEEKSNLYLMNKIHSIKFQKTFLQDEVQYVFGDKCMSRKF